MKAKPVYYLIIAIAIASCNDRFGGTENPAAQGGHIKIAVVSDIHYMDPALLQNGAENGQAFQDYLNADPKLIQYSDAITRQMISEVTKEKPDMLLIPGDLTKDGERVSHQSLVSLLRPLISKGIKVIVVPGNHDIMNPEARSYNGDAATPTPSVTPSEFASIYHEFGYGDAIYRDPNSLSYVSQPYSDIWILAIDDCKYTENTNGIAVIGGNIKNETMAWIKTRLAEAKQRNIRVFGMMHHNLIEHYANQNVLDPQYVTDNWEQNSNELMDAGLQVIFTGHYHANDVTTKNYNGNLLYDIETGSQVNPPLPYRLIQLQNKEMEVTTRYIATIDAALPGGMAITTYSQLFFSGHLDGAFSYLLTQPPFSMSDEEAANAAPQFRNAYMAHFAGDEKISVAEQKLDDAIAASYPIAGMALAVLWTDLNPSDNKVHVSLK